MIQNADGSLTMIFAGYRLPKPIAPAGTVLGTDTANPYTVGTTDPALYRTILTVTLDALPPTATPEAPDTLMLGGLAVVVFGVAVGYVRRRRRVAS